MVVCGLCISLRVAVLRRAEDLCHGICHVIPGPVRLLAGSRGISRPVIVVLFGKQSGSGRLALFRDIQIDLDSIQLIRRVAKIRDQDVLRRYKIVSRSAFLDGLGAGFEVREHCTLMDRGKLLLHLDLESGAAPVDILGI